ncbi:MAG: GGDEF domain-containing protein [Lachnospiraceae bacterium]|nr:GGDEF domain-containing protein [Lachnospiraceae bacterium]
MTKRNAVLLIIKIVFIYFLINFITNSIYGLKYTNDVLLDDSITSEIVRSDGTTESYASNHFPVLKKGDVLYAKIPLDTKNKRTGSVICFSLYDCVTELTYDNHILYSAGYLNAKRGKQIGHLYAQISIPDDAWGKELILTCHAKENNALSSLTNVQLLPALDSVHYFFKHHEIDFFLFLAIMIVSAISALFLPLFRTWTPQLRQGFSLSLFCLSVSLWVLSYNGILSIMSTVSDACSKTEYFSIFFLPIPFCAFFYDLFKYKPFKKLYQYMTFFYTGIFVLATLLNTYTSIHYSALLGFYHILMGIGLVITLYIFVFTRGIYRVEYQIIRIGALLSVGLLMLRLLLFNLNRFTGLELATIESDTFTSLGCLTLIVSMFISYVIGITNHYYKIKEERHMAYTDALTGINNRAGCEQQLKQLEKEKEFALVFFDLNNLKQTNDLHGHKHGDYLIRESSRIIKSVFEPDGFCGRYGGDEFIAGISADKHSHQAASDRMEECIRKVNEKFKKHNEMPNVPVKISVSYGISISTPAKPLSAEEALRMADKKMYKAKTDYKRSL